MKKLLTLIFASAICMSSYSQQFSDDLVSKANKGDDVSMYNLGNCYVLGNGVTKDYKQAARWFMKSAAKGNSDAMLRLGQCYQNGSGVSKDDAQAVMWFKKSAAKGNTDAYVKLGDCYMKGTGVAKDLSLSFKYIKNAAEKGHILAMYNAGVCYSEGIGTEKNIVQATEWYKKAAHKGSSDAMYNLAKIYQNGSGMLQDYTKAVYYYKLSADNGNADAMYELAQCYDKGIGVTQDYSEAFALYRMAGEYGQVNAMNSLAVCYKEGKGVTQEYEESLRWFNKAALKGNADAMSGLGDCYREGLGVERNYSEAFYWYKSSAIKGSGTGMNKLGECYELGLGVDRDYVKSVEWYNKAIEKGSIEAVNNLGSCYREAKGVNADYAKAMELYKKAAGKGNADAINNIGIMYDSGLGVEKDYVQSLNWFNEAVKRGNAFAMNNLGFAYFNGKGVEKDLNMAISWYEKSANKGCAYAMNNLGNCYLRGLGVKKDVEQALIWIKKAVNKGEAGGMNSLASMYFKGLGVEKNDDKAFYWLTKAVETQENEIGLFNLGSFYEQGIGTEQDKHKAYRLYVKSAEKGYYNSMNSLAKFFTNGIVVKKDDITANVLTKASMIAKSGNEKYAAEMVKNALAEYKRKTLEECNPPVLQIVKGSVIFTDASGNNAIDTDEKCNVRFKVKNIGKGDARNCTAMIKSSVHGISAEDVTINEIKAGSTADVLIPVNVVSSITDGTTDLELSVYEPAGFGCKGTVITVNTNAEKNPMLKLASYEAVSEFGSELKPMIPINLKLYVQNVDKGIADDVNVSIELPQNVALLDGEMFNSFASIAPGVCEVLNYSVIANNKFVDSSLPVKVCITEKQGKFGEKKVLNLAMSKNSVTERIVIDELEGEDAKRDMEMADIKGKIVISDVDRDIPHNEATNKNTFAVIIANENYENEEKVDFALNDGKMIKTYFREVLGLPEKNIHMVPDASLNNIRGQVEWLKQIAESYGGEASIMFYYAGHGIPDDKTKEAYLLPADGYGSSIITAYKLNDLYTALSKYPTKQTLIFLDACFSGSQRDDRMLVSARAVAMRPNKTAPKGNMIVFSASQGDESAYPYREQNHGLFTYFLLKKLKETNGNVTLGELGSYITTMVKRESLLNNKKRQTPSVQTASDLKSVWEKLRIK